MITELKQIAHELIKWKKNTVEGPSKKKPDTNPAQVKKSDPDPTIIQGKYR